MTNRPLDQSILRAIAWGTMLQSLASSVARVAIGRTTALAVGKGHCTSGCVVQKKGFVLGRLVGVLLRICRRHCCKHKDFVCQADIIQVQKLRMHLRRESLAFSSRKNAIVIYLLPPSCPPPFFKPPWNCFWRSGAAFC